MSDDTELTKEHLLGVIEALKKQSDEYWADPFSKTCGLGFPHVIGPHTYKSGGWTCCSNCGIPLEIEGDRRRR